jgi:hypothetical protein
MDAAQNLISILRANDWGIEYSGSWEDDETTLHRWGIIQRDGTVVDPSVVPLPANDVYVFARCLYHCFDADGEGLSSEWFPEQATPCWSSEPMDTPIESMIWDDVLSVAYS